MKELYPVLLVWLAVLNPIALAAMGIDKRRAAAHRRRIPETTLLLLAAFGGSVGGILGMLFFRHKTRKPKFYLGLPLILLAQVGLALWLTGRGL